MIYILMYTIAYTIIFIGIYLYYKNNYKLLNENEKKAINYDKR